MIRQRATKIRVAVSKSSSMNIAIDTRKNVVTIEGSLAKKTAPSTRREKSAKSAKKHVKKTVIDALKRLDSKIVGILRRNSSKLSCRDLAELNESKHGDLAVDPAVHRTTPKAVARAEKEQSFRPTARPLARQPGMCSYIQLDLKKARSAANSKAAPGSQSDSRFVCLLPKGSVAPMAKKFSASFASTCLPDDSQLQPHRYFVNVQKKRRSRPSLESNRQAQTAR